MENICKLCQGKKNELTAAHGAQCPDRPCGAKNPSEHKPIFIDCDEKLDIINVVYGRTAKF